MKNAGVFLLLVLAAMSANSQDAGSFLEIKGRHTKNYSASEVSYSLVQPMRKMFSYPEGFGVSLSDRDRRHLAEYTDGSRGAETLQRYKPLFVQELEKPTIDPASVGRLISESKEAEQQVYLDQMLQHIDALSPNGQRQIRTALNRLENEVDYQIVDWEGIASERPDLIVEMGRQFVERVDTVAERFRKYQTMPRNGIQNSSQSENSIVVGN